MHEEGFQVERLADGELQFRRPNGEVFPEAPVLPVVTDVDVPREQNTGIHVDSNTLRPAWFGERLNVGYAISVLHPRAIVPSRTIHDRPPTGF